MDRLLPDRTVEWELPESWTDGDVNLTAVINSSGSIPELTTVNNSASLSISFVRKQAIGLVMRRD